MRRMKSLISCVLYQLFWCQRRGARLKSNTNKFYFHKSLGGCGHKFNSQYHRPKVNIALGKTPPWKALSIYLVGFGWFVSIAPTERQMRKWMKIVMQAAKVGLVGWWWNPRSPSAIGDLPREEICTRSSQNTCKTIKMIARKIIRNHAHNWQYRTFYPPSPYSTLTLKLHWLEPN